MGNILRAYCGGKTVIKTSPLYQYDYGQILLLEGVELPVSYEVHFSNTPHGNAVTMIGDEDGVEIPDITLIGGSNVYAWLYLHTGEDDGETEIAITIPVIRRAQPTNGTPTPVQQDAITQAIAALNAAVTEAETAIEHYPTVTVTEISGGHEVTITDAEGDHTFDVMDGTGGGGTGDYSDLTNKPSIESVTLSGNKTASDLGLAKASDLSGKQAKITASGILKGDGNGGVSAATVGTDYGTYSKPSGGIPASDLASGVIPSIPSASSATPQPLGTADAGSSGDYSRADHVHAKPTAADIGAIAAPVSPSKGNALSYNGSAWVAGEIVENVSGSTPSITALAGVRYVCGEVSTLSITAPASGCIDVVFESGSTPTVLTVTSAKTGVTDVKWNDPNFNPNNLDANTVYEINILDGEFGVVGSWT